MEITRPVLVPMAFRMDFHSKVNQRFYSISVAPSLMPTPKDLCPVLYVLDAHWYFASAVEAMRRTAPGVAVVGIGYPDDEKYIRSVIARHQPLPVWAQEETPFMAAVGFERLYDLSLPATPEILAREFSQPAQISSSDVGGLDAFLQVLESEIKPRVAAVVPVDPANQAIFGHSLGGLAVVHALLAKPTSFRTFIAASPSLWWSDKAVLKNEGKFSDAVRAGIAAPRVLVTMGSEEEEVDSKAAEKLGMDLEECRDRVRRARMIENAREFTERLKSLRGSTEYEVEDYVVFPKQGHSIAAWPALGRGVPFAFA